MERSIRTDPLTGLLNRRGFFEHVQRTFEHADERSEPATVMMADVDRFKNINDTFGHAAGDDFLRRIARGIGAATATPGCGDEGRRRRCLSRQAIGSRSLGVGRDRLSFGCCARWGIEDR